MIELLLARCRLYRYSHFYPAALHKFLSDHAIPSIAAIGHRSGVFGILPCRFRGSRFALANAGERGKRAVIVEALARETPDGDGDVLDLVGWPVDAPQRMVTLLGNVGGLGIGQVLEPASYCNDTPLRVHRSALAWLRASCSGVVVLDATRAALWLGGAPGRLAGEDRAHAIELATMLHPFIGSERIVYPAASSREVAA